MSRIDYQHALEPGFRRGAPCFWAWDAIIAQGETDRTGLTLGIGIEEIGEGP